MQENLDLHFVLTPAQMAALDGLSDEGAPQRRTWKNDPMRDEAFC